MSSERTPKGIPSLSDTSVAVTSASEVKKKNKDHVKQLKKEKKKKMDKRQPSSGGGFFTRWFGGSSGSNNSQQNLAEEVIDARSERKTAKQREQELLQRSERRPGVSGNKK